MEQTLIQIWQELVTYCHGSVLLALVAVLIGLKIIFGD